MSKIVTAILALATFFIGQISTLLLENLRFKRQRTRIKEERLEKREDKKHSFQFKTLKEMQQAIIKLYNALWNLYAFEIDSLTNGTLDFRYSPDVSEPYFEALAEFVILRHRVTNEILNKALQEYNNFAVVTHDRHHHFLNPSELTHEVLDAYADDMNQEIQGAFDTVQEALSIQLKLEMEC